MEGISEPDRQFLEEALTNAGFRFAKSMPHNPHSYTLRDNLESDADFVRVVELIRKHGYPEQFKGKIYTLYQFDGFKYWTMGNPIEETTLINKKAIGVDGDGV